MDHALGCHSNGSHSNGFLNGNGLEEEEDEQVLIKRKERKEKGNVFERDLISLIGQHLRENGLNKTLDTLIEESGCQLEHPLAGSFRTYILNGEWTKALSTLDELSPLLNEEEHSIEKMKLLIEEERYMELLESGDRLMALQCLRHSLSSISQYLPEKRIQDLSQYVMCQSRDELLRTANWLGTSGGARQRLMDQLQSFLPATIMLPPQRLSHLLKQSLQLQIEQCPFHITTSNTSNSKEDFTSFTLLTDHLCPKAHFPSHSVHTLREHTDEVWYLQFSHDGTKLATGCKDGNIIIWNITSMERPVKEHTLKAQSSGVTSIHWSPNDSLLLSCGAEDCPEVIVYSTDSWEERCRVSHSSEDSLTCCTWHHSGNKFYVGGLRGQFYECCSDTGTVTSTWEGVRLHAIAAHPLNDTVYGADSHMKIKQYNFNDKTSSTLIKEDHSIMSFTLSKEGRYALLNVASQGVHMWDLVDQCLVRRYQGLTQGFYTIHSCFGINDNFIASGSEDHQLYIWNQRRETPIIILTAHNKTVNCVTWSPVHPSLIASASDDCTVVLWGTEEESKKWKELEHTNTLLHQESTSSNDIHVNGVNDDDSFEEEEEEEEEEGMEETHHHSNITISDLQSLELLGPDTSSSHDDSTSSNNNDTNRGEEERTISLLSLGISAVRERSRRQLSTGGLSSPPITTTTNATNASSVLVIMSSQLRQEENISEEGVAISEEGVVNDTSVQSRSFDLDSSIESTTSGHQLESTGSSEHVSVIIGGEGGVARTIPYEGAEPVASSNGSNTSHDTNRDTSSTNTQ